MKNESKLILSLVLIGLILSTCTQTRLIIKEEIPDSLGIFMSYEDSTAREMAVGYEAALSRQLRKYNETSDIHYVLADSSSHQSWIHITINHVRLNDHTAQFIALGVDMFGLFIVPALLREADSPIRFRFLLLPYDKTNYQAVYRSRAGYVSKPAKRSAGRVPFFEGETKKRSRQCRAFAENVIAVLEGIDRQDR